MTGFLFVLAGVSFFALAITLVVGTLHWKVPAPVDGVPQPDSRPWFKKRRYIGGILLVVWVASLGGSFLSFAAS